MKSILNPTKSFFTFKSMKKKIAFTLSMICFLMLFNLVNSLVKKLNDESLDYEDSYGSNSDWANDDLLLE